MILLHVSSGKKSVDFQLFPSLTVIPAEVNGLFGMVFGIQMSPNARCWDFFAVGPLRDYGRKVDKFWIYSWIESTDLGGAISSLPSFSLRLGYQGFHLWGRWSCRIRIPNIIGQLPSLKHTTLTSKLKVGR